MTCIPKHLKAGSECPPLKENQLRLYGMRFCPYVHRTKLVLSAKNITYEEVNINLAEKPDWYLAKNSTGQVPGLEWIDNSTKETCFIPESIIISEYLDEVYPENRLQPMAPYRRALQRVLIERSDKLSMVFIRILRSCGKEGLDEFYRILQGYEQALNDKYFGGSQPGMTDYMLWPWFERIVLLERIGFQLNADSRFPRLAVWVQIMEANEHVQKAKVPIEVTKRFMDGFRRGQPDYDIE